MGPNRCLIECGGRDLSLRYRDISYSSYDDLRKQYRPGEHHDCILKEYDRAAGLMRSSAVILAVVKYDYERSLIYGRILSEW